MNTKKCNKCKEIKNIIEFEHWRNVCKKCNAIYVKFYLRKHKKRMSILFKNWLSKNREKRKQYCKDWYKQNKETYLIKRKSYFVNLYKNKPWARILENIRARLHPTSLKRKKNKTYIGIKNFLTEKDLKFLWFRDKAYLMKKPSIHRKNSKKHYTLRNCELLELSVHNSYTQFKKRRTKCLI